jgi:hypothetical protein
MMVEIREGWIHGTLPGPNGEVEVILSPREDRKPWSKLTKDPPNLCLHTTEGSTSLGERYKSWEFPPNFACGDGHIVQLFPLGHSSDAVFSLDSSLLQVELAYRVADQPATKVYLPPPSTLDPLVALTAFLHEKKLITTGLRRPNPEWPVALDQLPAATEAYYRRSDGTWPKPGVYGHVDLPENKHYDPASFDYPTFFQMVQEVLDGGLTPEQERAFAEIALFLDTLTADLGHRGEKDSLSEQEASLEGAAKRLATTVLKAEKAQEKDT